MLELVDQSFIAHLRDGGMFQPSTAGNTDNHGSASGHGQSLGT